MIKNIREKLLHILSENTKEDFKDWFERSKIIDSEGNPLVLYHETNSENVNAIRKQGFNISKVGARLGDNNVPNGIFMKPNDKPIGLSNNSSQIPLYASIKNPLTLNNREEVQSYFLKNNEYKKLIRESDDLDSYYNKIMKELENEFYRIVETEGKGERDYSNPVVRKARDMYRIKTKEHLKEWHRKINIIATKARSVLTQLLIKKGYDGLIIENDEGSFGRRTKTIIALNPNQVRLVDER